MFENPLLIIIIIAVIVVAMLYFMNQKKSTGAESAEEASPPSEGPTASRPEDGGTRLDAPAVTSTEGQQNL